MENLNLASAIYRKPWAIDPETAQAYLPVVSNILNRNEVKASEKSILPLAVGGDVNIARYSYRDGFSKAQYGSVAVIDVNGVLMKNDQMCADGMETMGRMVREADSAENIKSIVLRIDSPGGTVDGTENFAAVIKSTNKRTVAFVNGMMASAALWIGACCDEIVASNEMDRIGSIGVMMSFADMQPALEAQGVKFHSIFAQQSGDKNRVFNEVKQGNYEEYRKEELDPLADRFIAHVKENRPNVKDDQLTGSMFYAKDVIGTLIDAVGTLEMAIGSSTGEYQFGVYGNNNEIAKQKESNSGSTTRDSKSNINNKFSSMNAEQFKKENPSAYDEIFNAGKKQGVSEEQDRVGSYMAFADSDLEGVKKGIESGKSMGQKEMAEFTIAATRKMMIDEDVKESPKAVVTPEAPKAVEQDDPATINALDNAFGNAGFNFKND